MRAKFENAERYTERREDMTTAQIVEKYGLRLTEDDNIILPWAHEDDKQLIAELKKRKLEIVSFLKEKEAAEKAAFEDRCRRIESIPGLTKIIMAKEDLASWHYEFDRSFDSEDGGGIGVRAKPKYDFEAMYAKYPVAAAYLKAKGMADKHNFEMAEIGEKALERIIYHPDEYKEALAEMEEDHQKFLNDHLWD